MPQLLVIKHGSVIVGKVSELKLLNHRHHDNFISEFLFDPSELNLDAVIDYFEALHQNGAAVVPRNDVAKDDQLFLSGVIGGLYGPSISELTINDNNIFAIYRHWQNISKICFDLYFDKYEIFKTKQLEHINAKIQRTKPSGGFHLWHHDGGSPLWHRQLVTLLYLNDDYDAGETEFLYQSVRIKPQAGKFIIFPAQWTHMHRGNPPIGGTKYILTSWVTEFPTAASK